MPGYSELKFPLPNPSAIVSVLQCVLFSIHLAHTDSPHFRIQATTRRTCLKSENFTQRVFHEWVKKNKIRYSFLSILTHCDPPFAPFLIFLAFSSKCNNKPGASAPFYNMEARTSCRPVSCSICGVIAHTRRVQQQHTETHAHTSLSSSYTGGVRVMYILLPAALFLKGSCEY